jgi:hypothetical protein
MSSFLPSLSNNLVDVVQIQRTIASFAALDVQVFEQLPPVGGSFEGTAHFSATRRFFV